MRYAAPLPKVPRQSGGAVEEVGEWLWSRDCGADEKALEAVFESLGGACVHRLIAAPHPFGLPPRDRRAAQRWLLRRSWARRWKRDLTILLLLVAGGLAAALLLMGLMPAIGVAFPG